MLVTANLGKTVVIFFASVIFSACLFICLCAESRFLIELDVLVSRFELVRIFVFLI